MFFQDNIALKRVKCIKKISNMLWFGFEPTFETPASSLGFIRAEVAEIEQDICHRHSSIDVAFHFDISATENDLAKDWGFKATLTISYTISHI